MLNKIYEKIKDFFKNNWKFILVLIGICLFFGIELPYVVYKPGGAIDLNNRIVVDGGKETKGKLQMAYVTMVKGSTPMILLAKLLPNWDIIAKDDITYEDESLDEMMERDKIYLQESIDNAIFEAYKLTGNEVNITKSINNIIVIHEKADTNLKLGDDLRKVAGEEFENLDEYRAIIQKYKVGDKVKLTVLRNGKERECYVHVYQGEEGLLTGISVVTTYEYTTNPKLEIKTKSSESGPSGGLMLALSIYNALTDADITKGRNIIGTGTIEKNGLVGSIGGVKYKLIGAVNKKADIFICPVGENYEEAIEVKEENDYDIKIIGVSSLEEAIEKLK